MTGKKTLFKNIASLGLVQIANYLFPLITVPIVARILGPDKYGVINYAGTFITYFNLLITYGFDLTATRKILKEPTNLELRNKVFSEVFLSKAYLFLLSGILFVICLYTVPLLREEKLVTLFSFIICIGTVFTQNWLFQAMQQLSYVSVLTFIGKLLFTCAILFVIRKKEDYVWQPLVFSSAQIIISVLSFIWAYKKYQLHFIPSSFRRILHLLYEERIVFFSMVIISLYTTTNTVVLGLFRNETEVGFYSAGQRLMDIAASVINLPLAQALFPFVGAAFAESKEKGIDTVQKIIPVVLVFTGIAALAMFFLGPYAIIWFYGKPFAPAIPVFQITTLLPMIITLSNIFGIQIMLNLKMDKLFFKITSCGAVLGLCLNIVMANYWGYLGTAWNWLLVELFITFAMYLVLYKKGIQTLNFHYFNTRYLLSHLKIKR